MRSQCCHLCSAPGRLRDGMAWELMAAQGREVTKLRNEQAELKEEVRRALLIPRARPSRRIWHVTKRTGCSTSVVRVVFAKMFVC